MNGCLSKILLIIIISVTIFLSYPYFIKYTGESFKNKVGELKTTGTVFTKIIKYIYNSKTEKND